MDLAVGFCDKKGDDPVTTLPPPNESRQDLLCVLHKSLGADGLEPAKGSAKSAFRQIWQTWTFAKLNVQISGYAFHV